ncbi:MAG TPA: hypothetical protein PLV45_00635 [bacterium]|nr:hypothetical protein [bacterium]
MYFDESNQGSLKYACKINNSWQVETLDSAGVKLAMALMNETQPVVVYTDYNGWLKIALKTEAEWQVSVLLDDVRIEDQPLLEINESGICHIVYHDEISQTLNWMGYYPDNQTTVNRQICQHSHISDYSSLAIDRTGQPHIVCYYYNILFYTYLQPNGVWIEEEMDYGAVGSTIFTSICVDSSGQVHLTYFSYLMDWYTYAYGNPGNWTINQIMESPIFGEISSMDVDSYGNRKIAFYNQATNQLDYAFQSNDLWEKSSIDSVHLINDNCLDIETDPWGIPFVCYVDSTEGSHLRLAEKQGNAWSIETFENDWLVSECDMFLDTGSNIHIALHTADTNELVLLARIEGNWIASALDTNLGEWTFPSISLESNGTPHIMYQKDQMIWHLIVGETPEPVCSMDNTPIPHKMALDSNNKPNLVFFNSISGQLTYSIRNDTGWIFTPILNNVLPGNSLALDLDSDNSAHVIVRDAYTAQLFHCSNCSGDWLKDTITYDVPEGSLDLGISADHTISALFFNGIPMLASNTRSASSPIECTIEMPHDVYFPGDTCYCSVRIENSSETTLDNVLFFCVLDIYETYFCYPSFSRFDYISIYLEPGITSIDVIPPFTWPNGAGAYYNAAVYAGVTDAAFLNLIGIPDDFWFSWME